MANFEFRGVQQMVSRIRDLSAELKERANAAIMDEANEIVNISKNEFVPVDKGELRESIVIERSQLSQGRNALGQFTSTGDIEIKIVSDLPYSAAVHETPSEHDPPTWEGKEVNFTVGGPKFIELPMRQAERGMASRIANKMRV